jgi:uncharacterized protein
MSNVLRVAGESLMAGQSPTDPRHTQPGYNDILVRTVQYGLKRMIFEKDVIVRSRAGGKLFVNVFRPAKEGRFPVVLSADIYGNHSIFTEVIASLATRGVLDTSPFAAWEAPDPGFWVPNDYVVVKGALRGSSGSDGIMTPLSLGEAEDYYDITEWAGIQPWSNGNVGTNGVSYLAMAQWRVAALNPPHLKAMIAWEGVSDMYREWSFHGGIPETNFSRLWMELQRARHPHAQIEDLTLHEREHPLFDAYWAGKKATLSDIKVPLYAGTSWATQGLHERGTIEGFKQASSAFKWLEIHGRKEWEYYYSRESLERQRRFFDCFLKGIADDWLETPRVRIEVRERFYDGLFRCEAEWPPARTRYVKLFLDATTQRLQPVAVERAGAIGYAATALPQGDGVGRAIFTTRFEQDTELTGHMKLRLWVSAEGSDDMDLFVGVKKIDRRGAEVHFADYNHTENGHVASGWLRVSHRELDELLSTPHRPWLKHTRLLKLEPGAIVPVDIEILPSSTYFRAGEGLQLVVQGSDILGAPTVALPAMHGAMRCEHRDSVNRGRHILHAGSNFDSHLLVPLIPASS